MDEFKPLLQGSGVPTPDADPGGAAAGGRGLHSFTSQLDLSRFFIVPSRVPLSDRLGGNHAPNVSHKMRLRFVEKLTSVSPWLEDASRRLVRAQAASKQHAVAMAAAPTTTAAAATAGGAVPGAAGAAGADGLGAAAAAVGVAEAARMRVAGVGLGEREAEAVAAGAEAEWGAEAAATGGMGEEDGTAEAAEAGEGAAAAGGMGEGDGAAEAAATAAAAVASAAAAELLRKLHEARTALRDNVVNAARLCWWHRAVGRCRLTL